MRNPHGYGVVVSPVDTALRFDGPKGSPHERREAMRAGIFETDTFRCGHCGRHTSVKPKMDPADIGGLCKCCMQLVCKYCVGKNCDTLEAKLDRADARERLYQAVREA